MPSARAYLREGALGQRGLAVPVVAPAGDRVSDLDAAGVTIARINGDKGVLALCAVAPALGTLHLSHIESELGTAGTERCSPVVALVHRS